MLDDLRIIILNERESGRLSEVPPTLDRADPRAPRLHPGEGLQLQRSSLGRGPDPDRGGEGDEGDRPRHLQDPFPEILSLALVQVEAEATERDELKKMLPPEREMFDGIVR